MFTNRKAQMECQKGPGVRCSVVETQRFSWSGLRDEPRLRGGRDGRWRAS
jgi:hypothetical protein